MLRTNRDAISEVRNDLKALNIDEYLPNKYIHHKLLSIADTLVKRDSDNRRLFNQRHLYKTIPCFELELASDAFCCEFNLDVSILKSKEQLPKTLATIYKTGITVLPLLNINVTFVETTPVKYKQILRRPYSDPSIIYYWITDNYLFFPNTTIEAVKVEGLFTDIIAYNKLAKCNTKCYRLLDDEFICPDYLLSDVISLTTKLIFDTYRKPVDDVPDMNSNNKQVNP